MVRIFHHRLRCIGCGYCEEVAPYRWQIDNNDGKASLIGASEKRGIFTLVVGDDELEDSLNAADLCPVKIIQVEKSK
jgi:ferredoxin